MFNFIQPVETTASSSFTSLKKVLHQAFLDEFECKPVKLGHLQFEKTLFKLIHSLPEFEHVAENLDQARALVTAVTDEVTGLGPIAALMLDHTVSDILINDYDSIWVEQSGQLKKVAAKFDSPAHLRRFADRILDSCGRQASALKPIVDGRLRDGSRVHVVVPPACQVAATVSIRKFSHGLINEQLLIESGYVEAPILRFLKAAIAFGVNMVICGNAGAGKTSLLNILAANVPSHERVITIEESAELKLQHNHVVQLEAHVANNDGHGELTLRDLVRAALRMRADRIIVGEVRGGEAIDMLQAMSCGHQGSVTTVHANSSIDALTRLRTLSQLENPQLTDSHMDALIGSSVQLVIHVTREASGKRVLKSIVEVVSRRNCLEHQVLYSNDYNVKTANISKHPSSVIGFMQQRGYHAKELIDFLSMDDEDHE